MKKWWIWAALAALLLGIGFLAGRSYLANREKAKRQKELWEKMESVTQDQTAEAEIVESVDPATLEGYLYAKELAALEEACEYEHYQTNDQGQTLGTFTMATVLTQREINAATEKFRAEHPEFYEELLAAIEKKIQEDIWDYEKDWHLEQLGLDGYDASRGWDVSYYFNWDESSKEPDRHLRVNLSLDTYLALFPDLINVEDASYSPEPSAKSAFSAVSEEWVPVAGYLKKEDYRRYYFASDKERKTLRLTTYANDGVTPLQTIRQRESTPQD